MEAAGIEPASRDTSSMASTCVVESSLSRPHPPLSTPLDGEPARNLFNHRRARHER